MRGSLGTLRTLVGASVILATAACADVETDVTEELDPEVAARYDFTCRGDALPAYAAPTVRVHGFTNDSYTGAGLDGVMVDLFAKQDGRMLDTTASDGGGVLSFELATGEAPLDHYARMRKDGHVTSYV